MTTFSGPSKGRTIENVLNESIKMKEASPAAGYLE
jgi:hypothetical protein